MIKYTFAAVSIALMLTPALAQSPGASKSEQGLPPSSVQLTEKPKLSLKTQDPNEWLGSDLMGASVIGAEGESIGEIEDVLIKADGTVSAVVVGVGGFLGIGEKAVAVPFSGLNLAREDDGDLVVTVNATKDELNAAPTYTYATDKK